MWHAARTPLDEMSPAMSDEAQELYRKHLPGLAKVIARSQKMAVPPTKVAEIVEQALTARRPRARYVVGLAPKLQLAFVTKLPTAVRDRLLRAVSSQPSRL